MGKFFNFLWVWIRFIFSPDLSDRRNLSTGFQKKNIPVWLFLALLLLVYILFIGSKKFNLYLPYEIGWERQDVLFPALDLWLYALILLYISGLCLFPKITTLLSCLLFAFYFLYGAANQAPVDFGLGFGEVIVYIISPFLSASVEKSLSAIWETLHFPGLSIYAFHFYLPLYVVFTAILTFIFYPARLGAPKTRPSSVDLILCACVIVMTVEYIMNFADRGDRSGLVLWPDVFMGTIGIIISIEMCRRILGWVLPFLGIFFFYYAMYGNYFPGRLLHKGFTYNEVTNFVYGNDGIFGVIANVYASYVFLFILFGVFLEKTKVGDVFIDLSYALVGRLRGGAAKASVVSSGLVGSVVGSGAANIVITGTFTIPLMKRAGFKPHYAAAVEAVSSIGGHLLPPIMGSAAFLVAAFTEIEYGWIALVSLVPALMYYFAVYMSVHFRSGMDNIHGLPKEELPSLLPLLKKDGYLLLPVVLLILRLIVGRSPFDAALWSIILAVVLGFLREDTRLMSFPSIIAKAIGRPEWSTQNDRIKFQATKILKDNIDAGKSIEEAEKVTSEYIENVKSAYEYSFMKENWTLFPGLALLIILPFGGHTIYESMFWALITIAILSSPQLIDGLEKGAINSLIIGVTAGVMGIVLAGVSMPGLGIKFSSIILGYSNFLDNALGITGTALPVAIFLCAAASYIMGMGMTITASYVLLSILAVPALVELGVPLLSAHLMILWLSQDASLTPPFALGAFIAAGLAGADPMKAGFSALKLAKALYVVPFLMAYTPINMTKGADWYDIGIVWITGFMGFFCASASLEGYVRRKLYIIERIIFAIASILLFFYVPWMKITGTLIMIGMLTIQYMGKKHLAHN
ncbi:MAG: TRAP transporter fused permease subunit [Nitrospinota bacterium]|nr:TRAP transporter fused permease subunit [Nitrospinota bacterium]